MMYRYTIFGSEYIGNRLDLLRAVDRYGYTNVFVMESWNTAYQKGAK